MVEIVFSVGVFLLAMVVVLIDKLIEQKRKIKHQQFVIKTQLADMRQMIFELREWENCVSCMIEDDAEKVLEMLEAKINRAEAEKCFWEPRRLNRIKESYLKLKNSAYENKKVSGEAAEK